MATRVRASDRPAWRNASPCSAEAKGVHLEKGSGLHDEQPLEIENPEITGSVFQVEKDHTRLLSTALEVPRLNSSACASRLFCKLLSSAWTC